MIFENISFERAGRILEEKVLIEGFDGSYTVYTQTDMVKGLAIIADQQPMELPTVSKRRTAKNANV